MGGGVMASLVTYRVIGQDFSGPSDTLDALKRAEKHARMWADSRYARKHGIAIFLISPGCLPVEFSRVHPSN